MSDAARDRNQRVTGDRLLYLNYLQTETGRAAGYDLPADYVAACRFLHCGIIDRTGTLDQGFPYTVLDPIPSLTAPDTGFGGLCDRRGDELLQQAVRTDRTLIVNWSGGIDSTTALIALIKAAEAHQRPDLLVVALSLASVLEYPRFYREVIDRRYRLRPVSHPLAAHFDPADINVTGEHGDQLFGSQLLESYVRRGVGGARFKEILPLILLSQFRNPRAARMVQRYLQPVVTAAPVPIVTLFDYLWWMNFALKWQDVCLRLPVFRGEETRAVYDSIAHFFRDDRFQVWSLAQGNARTPPTWESYKEAAKRYILDFTGDQAYYQQKQKVVSLRNVMVDPETATAFRVSMTESFNPVVTRYQRPPDDGQNLIQRRISAAWQRVS